MVLNQLGKSLIYYVFWYNVRTKQSWAFAGSLVVHCSSVDRQHIRQAAAFISFISSSPSRVTPLTFNSSSPSRVTPLTFISSSPSRVTPLTFNSSSPSRVTPLTFNSSSTSRVTPLPFNSSSPSWPPTTKTQQSCTLTKWKHRVQKIRIQ